MALGSQQPLRKRPKGFLICKCCSVGSPQDKEVTRSSFIIFIQVGSWTDFEISSVCKLIKLLKGDAEACTGIFGLLWQGAHCFGSNCQNNYFLPCKLLAENSARCIGVLLIIHRTWEWGLHGIYFYELSRFVYVEKYLSILPARFIYFKQIMVSDTGLGPGGSRIGICLHDKWISSPFAWVT